MQEIMRVGPSMLPISNGPGGFRLDDRPPSPPVKPSDSVMFDVTLQHGPMLFRFLRISRQIGISTAGKALIGAVDSWRVDDVALDGFPVVLTDGSVDPPRVATRVTMRATNIGEVPAYFYGLWELYVDLPSSEARAGGNVAPGEHLLVMAGYQEPAVR